MSENAKVYIHELIDIIGHNRARYFHHMTANWCPIGRAERNMSCFGVWGTVGSTGRWPEVVNLWELDGWDGLAANFAHELANPSLQDSSLAEWWSAAAELRRGGFDRVLVPEPWSPTIAELTAADVRGVVYAHELIRVGAGRVRPLLDAVHAQARDAVTALGGVAIGAFNVAMRNDDEALLLWAFREWDAWVRYEHAWDAGGLGGWRSALVDADAVVTRTLLADAPLAPLRIGRQPEESDRRPLSEIT